MKKSFTKSILTILILFITFYVNAQVPPSPNCPPPASSISITGRDTALCNQNDTLTASVVGYLGTDSYSVAPIPYSPFPWVGTNSITSILNVDDTWSTALPLPFDFCFYGSQYSQFIASSNGDLSFQIAQAGTTCPWSNLTWVLPQTCSNTTNNALNNGIFLNFDYYPPAGTNTTTNNINITWDVYGTAPCRALVVSWDSIPLFSCNDSLVSQQIVCYEGTNIIDINVKEKSTCSGWSGGQVAQEGIQNVNGTKATWVPGRNGTTFTLANDAYRFTPAGNNSITYTWYNAATNAVVGTGASYIAHPLITTKYYVKATMLCSNIVLTDTFTVNITSATIADFTGDVHLGCKYDTINFTNNSQNATAYNWTFGDGSLSIQTNPTHVYQTQNIYTVTLIAGTSTCKDTLKKVFNLKHPISANVVSLPLKDSICLGDIYRITNLSTTMPIVSTFNFGDGTIFTRNDLADTSHFYTQAGTYLFTLSVKDTLGCVDTTHKTVYVDPTPYVNFVVSDHDICLGSPVFFNDSIAPFTPKFVWDLGDGTIINNIHAPQHTYINGSNPAQYFVSLTGHYLVCKDSVFKDTINVWNYPDVLLSNDTSICEGNGASISLHNLNSSFSNGSNYLWSTGETSFGISTTTPGYYWLKETNYGGCSSTDSIWIKRDCYLDIPNSFSPNGDNLNDFFLPRELLSSGVTAYTMDIFNRWGELVFTTQHTDGRGWDGKFGGKDQPMGVYIYTIKVTYKNNLTKTFNGNVTLLR